MAPASTAYVASYALNLAAAKIRFLIEAFKASANNQKMSRSAERYIAAARKSGGLTLHSSVSSSIA
jgi:hypothetical protein